MIERTTRHFGRLVFDRDAIVRAALRAYVESSFHGIARFDSPAFDWAAWEGDIERGALLHIQDCNHVVVAWTEAGVVGLAYELGCGPIEQLGLSPDAVTGGPDDVRGAVTGLPDELEPALVLATGMLEVGNEGEKLAGVGFWLCGDRSGGTLFLVHDPTLAWGANRLAAWGLLKGGKLLQLSCESYPHPGKIVVDDTRPQDAPIHAIIDAVTDRALRGPTTLTTDELATLVPQPSELEGRKGVKRRLGLQRMLQKVGIAWPGSPKLPELPRLTPPDRAVCPDTTVGRAYRNGGEYMAFDREEIMRAALRAYTENIFAWLDPLERDQFPASIEAKWTGNPQRGAFFNGDGCGDHDVVAWTEAGAVALAYELGSGPIEQLGLSPDAVTGGPDDVRAALPELPATLESTLELAVGLLPKGPHGEKLAGVGFWLHGDRVEGTLFNDLPTPGVYRLKTWGHLRWGWLQRASSPRPGPLAVPPTEKLDQARAAPIQTLVDVVVMRALCGPTKLLPDELAMLFPTPPDPSRLRLGAQRIEKVGIGWPGDHVALAPPDLLPAAGGVRSVARCHSLGHLVFNQDAIVRAALRAYIEKILTWLDPAQRHEFPVCDEPSWTGDVRRGAFSNVHYGGHYDVVAWTEAGVVGLAYARGVGPIEQFGLSIDSVTGGPDDVRAAVPGLPDELFPALEFAVDLLPKGPHGEKLASGGFWLSGDRVEGTLFDDPTGPGAPFLVPWGMLLGGRRYIGISREFSPFLAQMERRYGAPIHAIIDAVVDRRLRGPTELLPDELATLLPVPIDMDVLVIGQRELRKVGITWPGSPDIAE